MKTKIIIFSLLAVFCLFFIGAQKKDKDIIKGDKMKETSIFKIDLEKKEIISPASNVKDYMKLKFISVTTDQPIYWPDEDVFLKVVFPNYAENEVKITLQKKDASPTNIGKYKLNDGGLLVRKILSGKLKRIEEGEYKVEVSITDKKIQSIATFSVVEGALGAVSFANEFEQITNPNDLQKVKGGWFLGNAAGIGMRWGNGLNVKNEIRVMNKPFNGKATIKSRCYLPGCNGIEAGNPIEKEIIEGKLEVVLDIGGHSGPFEIEVITSKGTVRNLFGKSGHVERQSVPLTKSLSKSFNATLAPYEGTIPVYGKQIFIEKAKETTQDVIEIISPICNSSNEAEFIVKKNLTNPKLYMYYPDKEDNFMMKEIGLKKELKEGEKIKIKGFSPYSFITIGGFINNLKDFYEGWAIVFTESPIDFEINAPQSANPLNQVEIAINTIDRNTKKGIPTYGILEVFDNRVPSKSAVEPLISSLGDSFRELSNYLSSWRDWTGIAKEEEAKDMSVSAPPKMKSMKRAAAPSLAGGVQYKQGTINVASISGSEQSACEEILETIRVGEKKVVFCDLIKTDANGNAKVSVDLPPQIGRCKVRFVTIDKYEYLEKVKEIDVQKENFVEVSLQPLLIPDSRIFATATVTNKEKENLNLSISGAGLKKELTFDIPSGSKEVNFELTGEKYGNLLFQLSDLNGKIKDKRLIEIKDISTFPVTFSEINISDGSIISVEKGRKVAIYSNPAKLLKGILMDVVTTMYSWFGHSEALSASCAARAMILRAIEDKIIDDEGLRETLKADLIKTIKDLKEKFFDPSKNLMIPYPGVDGKPIWSIWSWKNLKVMVSALEGNDSLKNEFSSSLIIANDIISNLEKELKKREISLDEESLMNSEGIDVLPVVIDGKVIYKAITDDAVVDWYVKKMLPILDLPNSTTIEDINKKLIKNYDTYRFLKAFERTGNIYYLLLNAKALLLKNDKNFIPLFNKIAKGMIGTQDPGMIKGPALLGGVYSAPQTLVKFLDLLIEMTKKKVILDKPEIEIISVDGRKNISLSGDYFEIEVKDADIKIKAPQFVTMRIDRKYNLNIYEYLGKESYFNIRIEKKELAIGEENEIIINLDKDKDPSEYYAVIAVPSVLSIRQTEDLLSDYKGQLIYGQSVGGGERIQMLTAPFRGSHQMVIHTEASMKGTSEGYVLIRHINNPEIISTVKIKSVKVN